MPVQLSPGDIVKATNLGVRALTIGWNSKSYKLEPGKPSIVPIEAVINWFGDPRSSSGPQSVKLTSGETLAIPPRESEVRRLSVLYGHQLGDVYQYLSDGGHDSTPVPKVQLETWDGEEIKSVLDDPYGESTTSAISTVADNAAQQAMIENLQRQLSMLQAQVGVQSGPTAFQTSDLPQDTSHLQSEPDPDKQPPTMSFAGPTFDDDESGPSPFNLSP